MEFRCRNDLDLEPKGPNIDNQSGLSQIDTIRASDIWWGRLVPVYPRCSSRRMDSHLNIDLNSNVRLRMEQQSGRGSGEPTEDNQASDVWLGKF